MLRALAVASLLLACNKAEKSSSVGSRADTSTETLEMDAEEIGRAPPPMLQQPDSYSAGAKGPLDKAAIKREVGAHLDRISACYEKRLAEQPRLTGETRVDFVIAQDGHVTSATGSGFDRDVDACVAGVIKTIMFPPTAAGTVSVSYPFRFRPS